MFLALFELRRRLFITEKKFYKICYWIKVSIKKFLFEKNCNIRSIFKIVLYLIRSYIGYSPLIIEILYTSDFQIFE